MAASIIVSDYEGHHNKTEYWKRLEAEKLYREQSTICIIPTRGVIAARVVENWWSLITPMNQKFMRIIPKGMEVGAAYSEAITHILSNPDLSTWKYILTLEEDNLPPPDGLLRLISAIEEGWDAVGGLYWTKGPGGQPMCYGDPDRMPLDFIPRIPAPDSITPCNGLGMGFTLFRLSMFKDERLPRPLFQTVQRFDPGRGGEAYTQDLFFFHNARKLGYKFACDSRVKVGHYDIADDYVW